MALESSPWKPDVTARVLPSGANSTCAGPRSAGNSTVDFSTGVSLPSPPRRKPVTFGFIVGLANFGAWLATYTRSPWTVRLKGVLPLDENGEPGAGVSRL